MISKWDISPAPNDKNPDRRKLQIKGEMKDIFLIVKKLGSICSRPEKTSGKYDFIIYLSRTESDTMDKLKSVVGELAASGPDTSSRREQAQVTASNLIAPVAPSPAPAREPAQPEPAPAPAPAPEAWPAAAPPAPEPQAPRSAPVQAPPPEIPPIKAPEAPPSSIFASVSPAPEPAPSPAPQPAEPPAQARPPDVPSETSRRKREEPAPAPVPEPKKEVPVPAAAVSRRSSVRGKWSVELPLVPTYSFETLVAGSHNRFAHAAGMAVVENPGMIYNPLLIFGVPGTGKTHFVHSISYGLSGSLGQKNIFVTDGVKLSKGVESAIKDGSIGKLDAMFAGLKALVIDDIHLMMLTESNKRYISKWLNEFISQNKQIVVTSVFPPKSLAGLEENIGFQFTQGWMVDLKVPTPQVYKVIVNQILQGMDVKLSDEELTGVFVNKAVPFGEVIKILECSRKLEKFILSSANGVSPMQLLDMVMGFSEPGSSPASPDEISKGASWAPPPSQGAWFRWGIFYPKGMAREAKYALYRMDRRSQELGLKISWDQVFTEEYDPDELYGIPFKIGNFAADKNVNGVVVVGPQPSSALGAQEAEFRHITRKILESFLVKGAWLQSGRLGSDSAYARALMDLV